MPIRFVRRQGGRLVDVTRSVRRKATQARRRARVGRKMMRDSFAQRVMRVINRTEETKYVANAKDGGLVDLPNYWYPPGDLPAAEFIPGMPALTQGTDDYQRVGNVVKPKSIAVSVKVGLNPQNTQACSLLGVIYYGTSKDEKNWGANSPAGNGQILDEGDGTTTAWSGVKFQLNMPIERHQYNLKRIVFRLSKTEGIQNADISGNEVVQGNYSTSNGLSVKNFMLRFKAPASLQYKSGTAVFPSNFAPFWGIGFCHADGSPLVAADRELVQVTSRCHMYYKDA